jgi:hypothetical protein
MWLSLDDVCARCHCESETLVHLLQDCPKAALPWQHLFGISSIHYLFYCSIQQWIDTNDKGSSFQNYNLVSLTTFVVIQWQIWL